MTSSTAVAAAMGFAAAPVLGTFGRRITPRRQAQLAFGIRAVLL